MKKYLAAIAAFLLGLAPASAQNAAQSVGGQPLYYLSAANTNSTLMHSGWTTVIGITVINTTATVYYLKLYNKATAPTCGTDTPVQVYAVPASTSGNGFTTSVPIGFPLGAGFCLTGGIADNDTSNAATGITLNFVYK